MAHVHSKSKKPVVSIFGQLIENVRADIIGNRLVRCSKCRDFFWASTAAVCSCSVCTYASGRCQGCGGEHGAEKSVAAHIRAFASRKLQRRFGDAHALAVAKVHKTPQQKMRKLHAISGGKK